LTAAAAGMAAGRAGLTTAALGPLLMAAVARREGGEKCGGSEQVRGREEDVPVSGTARRRGSGQAS
jgi:hypothetical protein